MNSSIQDDNGYELLEKIIEENRERLLQLGAIFGLNDPEVLNASSELDALIVSFYKYKMKKGTPAP